MRLGCDTGAMVIRYMLPKVLGQQERAYGFATVVPIKMQEAQSTSIHRRWQTRTSLHDRLEEDTTDAFESEFYEPVEKTDILGPLEDGRKMLWIRAPSYFSEKKVIQTEVDAYFGDFAEMALFRGKVQRGKPQAFEGVPLELVFGDPKIAAIYRIPGEEKAAFDLFEAEDVRAAVAVKPRLIPQSALLQHLADVQPKYEGGTTLSPCVRSLKTLSTICKVYEHLDDATIAMTLTSRELHTSKWMPSTDLSARPAKILPSTEEASELKVQLFQAFEPVELDLASTFACIAMLESGNIDLPEAGLQSVMAMSSGDSLFIANSLLSDPSRHLESNIRRIRGNVGRAGIAMLVPPEETRTRKTEAHEWNCLNYDAFDGLIVDSFKATSLHMSFTDFVLPIDTGFRGLRDMEIYFLETVISVHDKGEWMGDLDVVPVHRSSFFRLISQTQSCSHA